MAQGRGADDATSQPLAPHEAATSGAGLASPAGSAPLEPVPTFAEEGSGPLNPLWTAFYAPGDSGFSMDADFTSSSSQVSVANGMVTIKAERKTTPSGRPYASAMIGTRTTFAQAYGVWEARLRYSAGQGVWPGFFLLPRGQMAPYPEIDILEAYPGPTGTSGGLGKSVIVTTVHVSATKAHHIAFDTGIDLTTDFHTYRMEWTPDRLVFSLDGAVYWTLTEDVPSIPMYPILDLAMGASGFRVDETTPDPTVMDVEYVRVYGPVR